MNMQGSTDQRILVRRLRTHAVCICKFTDAPNQFSIFGLAFQITEDNEWFSGNIVRRKSYRKSIWQQWDVNFDSLLSGPRKCISQVLVHSNQNHTNVSCNEARIRTNIVWICVLKAKPKKVGYRQCNNMLFLPVYP